MAHSLNKAAFIVLAAILAGCGTNSTAIKYGTPARRLTEVLTSQQQADNAYHAGNFDLAAKLYLELTKLVPTEANYWYLLGNTYVRMQQPDLAVQAYQQAIMRDPNHARAWHNLGIVRMRQAEAAFVSSATTAKPGDPMRDVSSHIADGLAKIGSGNIDPEKHSVVSNQSTGAVPTNDRLPAPTIPAETEFPTLPPGTNIPAIAAMTPAHSSMHSSTGAVFTHDVMPATATSASQP